MNKGSVYAVVLSNVYRWFVDALGDHSTKLVVNIRSVAFV